MGTLWPENLCVHRKGAVEELIKSRARDGAAQPQNLFGKPTGDHVWLEELLVELLTSFTGSLFSHVLMSSCEHCEVSQIPNQVRSPIGDHGSVDPGDSSKRPAEDRRGCSKRRRTDKHDQGCQAEKQVQRIQEAPHLYPTNYFDHHTCRSYPLNNPSQNPLLEVYLLSLASEAYALSITSETISTQHSETYPFSIKSETISTQDSDPYRLSFSSDTISTQYSEPYPLSPYRLSFSSETISTQSEPYPLGFSSETISTQCTSSCPSSECGEETNALSGDLLLQLSQRPQPDLLLQQSQCPQPMIVTSSQGMESHLKVNFGEVKVEEALQRSRQFNAHLPKRSEAVAIWRDIKQKLVIKVQLCSDKQRARAMKIASASYGVTSIAITGDDKDQVVVIGEGMDTVKLTKSFRKKVSRNTELVCVEEVKPKDDEEPKKEQASAQGIYCYPYQYDPQPALCSYEPDYNPNPCSIM